jgi:hypothetical protein
MRETFVLIKDGVVWDYAHHMVDVLRWGCKVRKEEPDAVLEIGVRTQEEWDMWRDW